MQRKIINVQDVINYLTDHPCSRVEVIAEHSGVTISAMRSKLRIMLDAGQLKGEKIKGALHYSVKPQLPWGVSPNALLFNSLLSQAKSSTETRL
ncbi:hypothetical protein CTX76_004435 [Salmonella enterica subsp. houtenae]|uniref:ArsR family transcriptional regulator n=2 Tax=Salmonella enterica TaxID=28901 RepID=A0A5U9NZE0_SALMU|nr:hypothetical protein [Salmonella enterica]EAA1528765.1 hypothetical protein [Salmonella enterica subsp. enterica serovar Tennessee]EAA3607392.1 hypothetical protein [Salmonella enterica subsp. enterica serovar Senftenberg]EAA5904690.1 hypothetical protein [Salmonella enterica subsp. enterica]EAB8210358.1 hypothetical protein [Salmonella enterica subsp. enterica serovar Lattenkamp]EBR0042512.1 hypothetical protein [Salmonella enterica subsp. enterica serovar Oranienburg]EBS3167671.1 hypothe